MSLKKSNEHEMYEVTYRHTDGVEDTKLIRPDEYSNDVLVHGEDGIHAAVGYFSDRLESFQGEVTKIDHIPKD